MCIRDSLFTFHSSVSTYFITVYLILFYLFIYKCNLFTAFDCLNYFPLDVYKRQKRRQGIGHLILYRFWFSIVCTGLFYYQTKRFHPMASLLLHHIKICFNVFTKFAEKFRYSYRLQLFFYFIFI